MNISLSDKLNKELNKLEDRDKKIIEMYFGLNGHKTHTLKKIGEKFNICGERVRHLKYRTVRKLAKCRGSLLEFATDKEVDEYRDYVARILKT